MGAGRAVAVAVAVAVVVVVVVVVVANAIADVAAVAAVVVAMADGVAVVAAAVADGLLLSPLLMLPKVNLLLLSLILSVKSLPMLFPWLTRHGRRDDRSCLYRHSRINSSPGTAVQRTIMFSPRDAFCCSLFL